MVHRPGGYVPHRITVTHLLEHTSGLVDHAMDEGYQHACLIAPGRVWTRLDQVAWAMGMPGPTSDPGEAYLYSDTGYILLPDKLAQPQ